MSINVVVAFSNMLFSEGICKLLENDDEIKIADVLKPGIEQNSVKLDSLSPDVILVDLTTLYNTFANNMDTAKKGRFILFDTDCGRENIVSAILTKKINGVLLGHATPSLLKKSIRAVAKGDIWIDKSTIKTILYGINALNKDKTAALSDKEKKIVHMIGQGFRNKEVAVKLFISESTVKSHLRNIFRKLDINNRSQLIAFAIKNYDISGSSL